MFVNVNDHIINLSMVSWIDLDPTDVDGSARTRIEIVCSADAPVQLTGLEAWGFLANDAVASWVARSLRIGHKYLNLDTIISVIMHRSQDVAEHDDGTLIRFAHGATLVLFGAEAALFRKLIATKTIA